MVLWCQFYLFIYNYWGVFCFEDYTYNNGLWQHARGPETLREVIGLAIKKKKKKENQPRAVPRRPRSPRSPGLRRYDTVRAGSALITAQIFQRWCLPHWVSKTNDLHAGPPASGGGKRRIHKKITRGQNRSTVTPIAAHHGTCVWYRHEGDLHNPDSFARGIRGMSSNFTGWKNNGKLIMIITRCN